MHVMDKGGVPHTRYVRGTNYNFISVFPDRLPGRAIVISGARTALCMLPSHAGIRAGGCAGQGIFHGPAVAHVCNCRSLQVVVMYAHTAHLQPQLDRPSQYLCSAAYYSPRDRPLACAVIRLAARSCITKTVMQ